MNMWCGCLGIDGCCGINIINKSALSIHVFHSNDHSALTRVDITAKFMGVAISAGANLDAQSYSLVTGPVQIDGEQQIAHDYDTSHSHQFRIARGYFTIMLLHRGRLLPITQAERFDCGNRRFNDGDVKAAFKTPTLKIDYELSRLTGYLGKIRTACMTEGTPDEDIVSAYHQYNHKASGVLEEMEITVQDENFIERVRAMVDAANEATRRVYKHVGLRCPGATVYTQEQLDEYWVENPWRPDENENVIIQQAYKKFLQDLRQLNPFEGYTAFVSGAAPVAASLDPTA